MKKQTIIPLVILISLIIILIIFNNANPYKGDFVNIISQDKGNMLTINTYDKFGNSINSNYFSIVQNTPNVYYIDFTVSISNTGSKDLNCSIINASPNAFAKALPTNIITSYYNKNTQAAWTSVKLNTSQFESTNLTNFNVTVNCTYSGGSKTQNGYVVLNISRQTSQLVIFRTNVNQGSPGPAYIYENPNLDAGNTSDGKLKWIAFDKNGDGIMEKYAPIYSTLSMSSNCNSLSTSYGYSVLLYMPFGNTVCQNNKDNNCDVWILSSSSDHADRIGICYNNQNLNGAQILWWSTSGVGAGNASIINSSIAPYNANGQERYIYV